MLVASYGSLRRGFHNNTRYGEMKYLGDMEIEGAMYLVYNYPRLYPDSTADHKTKHLVEVFEVTEEQHNSINLLEEISGYYIDKIMTEWGEASIWYAIKEHEKEETHPIKNYTLEIAYETVKTS